MPPKRDPPSMEESMAAMADNLSKLLTASASTATQLETLAKQLASNTATTANLVTAIAKTDPDPPPPPPFGPPPPPPHAAPVKSPKILLPFFDGSAPLDWLFQADQYFNFYQIHHDQRLTIVAFHLKGDALSWYKYLHNNHLLTDWPAFTRALELRFGPSSFENHQASLFKLRQTGYISAYQTDLNALEIAWLGFLRTLFSIAFFPAFTLISNKNFPSITSPPFTKPTVWQNSSKTNLSLTIPVIHPALAFPHSPPHHPSDRRPPPPVQASSLPPLNRPLPSLSGASLPTRLKLAELKDYASVAPKNIIPGTVAIPANSFSLNLWKKSPPSFLSCLIPTNFLPHFPLSKL